MDKKVVIECSEKEAWLIERCLDFYSRVGAGQFDEITDHPTFDKNLDRISTPDKEPEVGDRTAQGRILEIKDGKALIDGSVKDGMWCQEQEWKDLKDVKLSCDYNIKHELEREARIYLFIARNILYGEDMPQNGNWGIYNKKLDDTCREAFHLYQVMRHERYLDRVKNNPEEAKSYGVDAYPADCCQIAGMNIPKFKMVIK